MNQRGFIALPMMAWGAIAAGVVIVGLGIGLRVQTARLETAKAETVATQGRFDAFVAQVKALGEAQAEKAKAEDAANKQRQEKANAENAKTRAALTIALDSLRRSTPNPAGRPLPVAPTGSKRPDLICLDRAVYQREDGAITAKLFAGARGLADEGTAATVDLDTAKRWAIKTP